MNVIASDLALPLVRKWLANILAQQSKETGFLIHINKYLCKRVHGFLI
jgi:hypothetical protein